MLYLVRPNFSVEYDTGVGGSDLRTISEHGGDLSRLDWKQAEDLVYSDDLVTLALIRGVRCSAGIVLDAADVYVLKRPLQLYETATNAQSAIARLRKTETYQLTESFLEAEIPGWKAHGEETDRGVARGLAEAMNDAIREQQDLLCEPIDPVLEGHWHEIGGVSPL